VNIPQVLTNFRVYGQGARELLGVTDIELPSFEVMKETISGAGIAGEVSVPVVGHFASQSTKLKWRGITKAALELLAPVVHVLDMRGSLQNEDPSLGRITSQAIRVECTGTIGGLSPGKFEPGKVMGTECDVECRVLRVYVDNVPIIELDKLSMIFKVNGIDYLQKTRQDMGGV